MLCQCFIPVQYYKLLLMMNHFHQLEVMYKCYSGPNQLSPFRSNLHKKKRKHISLVTNLHPQQKRNIIISLLTKVTSCILGPKMFVNQNKIGRPYVLRYTPVDEILRYNKKKK